MNDTIPGPQPYDVYARLEDPMGVLGFALGQWVARDDNKPRAEVRRAANTAMDAIDRMLAGAARDAVAAGVRDPRQ